MDSIWSGGNVAGGSCLLGAAVGPLCLRALQHGQLLHVCLYQPLSHLHLTERRCCLVPGGGRRWVTAEPLLRRCCRGLPP